MKITVSLSIYLLITDHIVGTRHFAEKLVQVLQSSSRKRHINTLLQQRLTSVIGFCVAAKEEDTKEGVIYQGDSKGFMQE